MVAFLNDWQLALLLCGMAPLMAAAFGGVTTVTTRAEAKEQAMYAQAGAIAQERLGAIRTVQACGRQEAAVEAYKAQLQSANSVWAIGVLLL